MVGLLIALLAPALAGGGGGSFNSGAAPLSEPGVNAGHGRVVITLLD